MGVSSTRPGHFNPKPAFRMQGPRPPDGHTTIVPNQAPLIAVVDSASQFGTSASCGDVYKLRILREQSRSSQKWIQCCCVGDDTIPRSWSAEVENGHRVLHVLSRSLSFVVCLAHELILCSDALRNHRRLGLGVNGYVSDLSGLLPVACNAYIAWSAPGERTEILNNLTVVDVI